MVRCRDLTKRLLKKLCKDLKIKGVSKYPYKPGLVRLCCQGDPDKDIDVRSLESVPRRTTKTKKETGCRTLNTAEVTILKGLGRSSAKINREIAGSVNGIENLTVGVHKKATAICPTGRSIIYHTHPRGTSIPSPADIANFLTCKTRRSSIVTNGEKLFILTKPPNWQMPDTTFGKMEHEKIEKLFTAQNLMKTPYQKYGIEEGSWEDIDKRGLNILRQEFGVLVMPDATTTTAKVCS